MHDIRETARMRIIREQRGPAWAAAAEGLFKGRPGLQRAGAEGRDGEQEALHGLFPRGFTCR